jgi:hypothetical protein
LPQEIILTHNTDGVTRCPALTHSRRLRIAGAYPGADLHGLERVWTPAELGTLIVEATNRKPLLDLGRNPPQTNGPALDPRLLPDDRLCASYPDASRSRHSRDTSNASVDAQCRVKRALPRPTI